MVRSGRRNLTTVTTQAVLQQSSSWTERSVKTWQRVGVDKLEEA